MKLPKEAEYHADLIIHILRKSDPLTRTELRVCAERILKDKGYIWQDYPNKDHAYHKWPVYKYQHNALNLIARSNMEWDDCKLVKAKKEGKLAYKVILFERDTEKERIEKVHVNTPDYVHLSSLLHLNMHVAMEGPPGIGKTWSAEAFARFHDYDFYPTVVTETTTKWSIIGRSNLLTVYSEVENYMRSHEMKNLREASLNMMQETWIDGIVTQACRNATNGNKTVLLIDEFNLGDPALMAGLLNSVCDDGGNHHLTISDTGEHLKWDRKNLLVIVTMNPDVRGSKALNQAIKSRFVRMRLQMPKYDEIVRRNTGVEPSEGLIELFEKIRDTTMDEGVGLRDLIRWTVLEDNLPSKTVKRTIVDQFKGVDRATVNEVILSLAY